MRGKWRAWAAVVAVGVMMGASPVAPAVQARAAWTVPTQAGDFLADNAVLFSCTLNGHPYQCELDTGIAGVAGLYISQTTARDIGALVTGSARVLSVTSEVAAQEDQVALSIGEDSGTVLAVAYGGYDGGPLVGLGALRGLGVKALALDLQAESLILVDGRVQ